MSYRAKILFGVTMVLILIVSYFVIDRYLDRSKFSDVPRYLLLTKDFKKTSDVDGSRELISFSIKQPTSLIYAQYLDILTKNGWDIQKKTPIENGGYRITAAHREYLRKIFRIVIEQDQSDKTLSRIGIVIELYK